MKVGRSYGGKAGIWLKKRRTRASIAPACAALRSVALVPEDNNAGVHDLDESRNDKNASSSKLKTIGWDEALCRPVYKGTDHDTKIATEDAGTKDEEVDVNEQGMVEEQLEGEVKRCRRKYGSRKRSMVDLSWEGGGPDPHGEHPVTKRQTKEAPSPRRVSSGSCDGDRTASKSVAVFPVSEEGTAFGLTSPLPMTDSICLTLNSETKKATSTHRESNHAKKEVRVNDVSPNSDSSNLPTRQETQSSRPRQQLTGTVFEFVDYEPVHQQPSSTTSVNAAKAFFERLDSTQKLVIDGSDSPSIPGQRCVRTTRTTNMANPTLKEEYHRYSAASVESGVKPLSIQEYAVNRGTYFRSSEMFDGFLDE